ncbi:MAG: hypothetical protein IH988_03900 [Planctomycetes bacterium]|nr:hypothetical protein [Planctomycetota bacterium]
MTNEETPNTPIPSIRALMEGIVDYAGLFPPAKLPLDEALRNFAEYRRSEHAWMLGRFICPAGRLDDIAPYASLLADGEPWAFSVLGRGGEDAESFNDGLAEDFALIDAFVKRHPGRVRVDAFEVRLPTGAARGADDGDVRTLLRRAAEAIDRGACQRIHPFLEISLWGRLSSRSLVATWPETLDLIIPALAEHNREWHGERCGPMGAKIRTGGVEADQFPTIEQVAGWIARCAGAGVPFKATAGLHHPFRHYCDAVGTRMHGFVNLFLAAALAHRDRNREANNRSDGLPRPTWLQAEALQGLLADESAGSFSAEPGTLGWREARVTVEEIRSARASLAISFGSCSFTDPIEDLQAAGML